MVQLRGRMPSEDDDEEPLRLFVSMMFLEAIMTSISQSWNRSTTSAHVSWKRLSFSIFLKTVDLISTNWLDIRRVRRALE